MITNYTDPHIVLVIITNIKSWRSDGPIIFPHQAPKIIQEVITWQNEIGWYNLLLGRMVLGWEEIQQLYYVSLGRRNTGKAWLMKIIAKVWEVSWDQWDNRNDVLHNSLTAAKKRDQDLVNQQVQVKFTRGTTGLRHRFHHWFNKPLHSLLRLSVKSKEQWLQSVELSRHHSRNNTLFEDHQVRQQRDTVVRAPDLGAVLDLRRLLWRQVLPASHSGRTTVQVMTPETARTGDCVYCGLPLPQPLFALGCNQYIGILQEWCMGRNETYLHGPVGKRRTAPISRGQLRRFIGRLTGCGGGRWCRFKGLNMGRSASTIHCCRFLTGSLLLFFSEVSLNRLFVKFIGFPLDDLQGSGGAGTKAGTQTVTEFIGNQPGFAVDHF